MELHLHIYIITLILLIGVIISSQVSALPISPDMYWNKELPGTPMPTAIKSSLQGKDGKTDPFRVPIEPASTSNGNRNYRLAATEKEVDGYVNMYGEIYMLETQMIPGKTVQVRLRTHTDNKATFLPQYKPSTDFSSDKLPEILNKFSIKPRSRESAAVEETIRICRAQQQQGEVKLCATSLEAMVSFAKSQLGNRVTPISSFVKSAGKINYKITGVNKLVDYGSPTVVCHKQQYPYAVFYCHKLEMTALYVVSMVGEGINVNAAAACHKDTSWWNPKHLSFQLVKAKPGKTTSVCHFLDDLSVVWTKK